MSEQVWMLAGLLALIVGVMPWLLLRDLRRAVARHEARLRLHAHVTEMAARFEAFKVAIGTAMFPAMGQAVRAAADMQEAMQRVTVTLTADTSGFTEVMRKLREAAQPSTLDHDVAANLGAAMRAAMRREDRP